LPADENGIRIAKSLAMNGHARAGRIKNAQLGEIGRQFRALS
jgi:hypothetical protein